MNEAEKEQNWREDRIRLWPRIVTWLLMGLIVGLLGFWACGTLFVATFRYLSM